MFTRRLEFQVINLLHYITTSVKITIIRKKLTIEASTSPVGDTSRDKNSGGISEREQDITDSKTSQR